MVPINNPYIRDTIIVNEGFSERLGSFAGDEPIYLMARVVEQRSELRIGARSVVIVADELHGNGHLINAVGTSSVTPGVRGSDAGPTPPGYPGGAGGAGTPGGAGGRGGNVTVMCRHSSGVSINVAGGAGASGGDGGNGGPGANGTTIPGGTTTEVVFDRAGNPSEVEVPLPDIDIPGQLGGWGGAGGMGGAGGDAGTLMFTSMVDDTAPILVATAGPGGSGGALGANGPDGLEAVIPEPPEDPDTTWVFDATGAFGAEGTIIAVTVAEEEFVAGLRPLLDAQGPSFANHWAPYRLAVGQYLYRQHRRSNPSKGQEAATEFARTLELQPDNVDALRWQRQLLEFPRPLPAGPELLWEPGGINALGFPRNMDVLPRFEAYRDAFTSFGSLVVDFLTAGTTVLLEQQNLALWKSFLSEQRRQAGAAQETTLEDRDQAETESRLAAEAIASVQTRLDQTTQDIQAALEEMREEPLTIGDIVGTVAGVAAAVVAVVAAIPSAGASLVALVPAMVALSSVVIDNAEPIAKAVLAGDTANTDAIKKAYDKVDKDTAAVVKSAKAVVDFVHVVQKLTAATTPDNSKHMALVRQGVELTHELLLSRHRATLAQQRLDAAHSRVARAGDAVAGIDAVIAGLDPTEETIRRTGLYAIAIAEAKADALLTLAFLAQRSVEIYTLTDQEDKVRLESGHLHPDDGRSYAEAEINELELVQLLHGSWGGLLDLLDLELDFDRFTTQFHDRDRKRLSFQNGGPELETLRDTHSFSFRIDAATLPGSQSDAKVLGVRLALVGATSPAAEVTCEVRHGGAYETRRSDGSISVTLLQPRVSNRDAKLDRLVADEGLGPDPLLTEPQSLAFWGRGIGGEWQLSIPDHEFEAGLDLSGLTEVQVWIGYQFLR